MSHTIITGGVDRLRRVREAMREVALAETKADREAWKWWPNLMRRLRTSEEKVAGLEAALAAIGVCGPHCPACVGFMTVFTLPRVKYLACLRLQSDSTALKNRVEAPLGQICPYRKKP